jgi:hypothetical protein
MTLKKLHRIYFGFDGKPDVFSAYLRTWERELPEFEICHWNATNLPLQANDYTRHLYAERDAVFLSDYFRWWVLREHGGVYLDADIEVTNGRGFAQLVSELEATTQFEAFIGVDERQGGWYTAHSVASKPGSSLASYMCEVYENLGHLRVWRKKALYLWAPQLTASYFANKGHIVDGMGATAFLDKPVVAAGVKIYPQQYFSPLAPTGNREKPFVLSAYTEDTVLCHHFACTWHEAGSIYRDHAQEKGGGAGVMLKDILKDGQAETHESFIDWLRRILPTPIKRAIRALRRFANMFLAKENSL